jgi:demethylmenaquinone methyltransferase/2-methoxy-6-polyprenyl-1,4-benzoquinol methylase
MTLIDVAGGTGDIAKRVLDRVAPGTRAKGAGTTRAVVCDINPAMLAVGRARLQGSPAAERMAWVAGDAEALPIADRATDAYTIAFGIRNVTHLDRALAEARRVLVPGGRFLCLEFGPVVVPGLDALYDAYSFRVLPWLGRQVAGDEDAYRYLAESIRRFPAPDQFAALIAQAGLGRVEIRRLSGGIANLYSAWRL